MCVWVSHPEARPREKKGGRVPPAVCNSMISLQPADSTWRFLAINSDPNLSLLVLVHICAYA